MREKCLWLVHQEARAVLVYGEREVLGDALVHSEPRGPAEGRGEVHPFGPMGALGFGAGRGVMQHAFSPSADFIRTRKRGPALYKR